MGLRSQRGSEGRNLLKPGACTVGSKAVLRRGAASLKTRGNGVAGVHGRITTKASPRSVSLSQCSRKELCRFRVVQRESHPAHLCLVIQRDDTFAQVEIFQPKPFARFLHRHGAPPPGSEKCRRLPGACGRIVGVEHEFSGRRIEFRFVEMRRPRYRELEVDHGRADGGTILTAHACLDNQGLTRTLRGINSRGIFPNRSTCWDKLLTRSVIV